MESAREETGHGHAHRGTAQSAFAVGQAAGRRTPLAATPANTEAAGAGVRPSFDAQHWLRSREIAPRPKWVKVGGVATISAMLGALAWVGYRQFPTATAKADDAGADVLVIDGAVANEATAASDLRPVQFAAASQDSFDSPFDAPQAFKPDQPAAEVTIESPVDNPFAAFAPRRMSAAEPEAGQFERFQPGMPGANAGVVSLASNETVAPAGQANVDAFAATPQFEPAGQFEPASTPAPAAGPSDGDPFAAFKPGVKSEAAQSAEFGPMEFSGAEAAAASAEWGPAESQREVIPVQFNAASAAALPVEFEPATEAPAEFAPAPGEPALRPAAAPTLTRPTALEPGAWDAAPASPGVGQRSPQPYSPGVERTETTSFQVPMPADGANDSSDETLHVVQRGETYWSISRQHYGAGRYFQALEEYNKPRITSADALRPGMKVLVPSAKTLDVRYGKVMQASGHAKPAPKPQSGLQFNAQGQPFYIVGEGDTLGEIATRYLGKTLRSEEIFRLNQEQLKNANSLKTGMILLMPADASEVQQASTISGRR